MTSLGKPVASGYPELLEVGAVQTELVKGSHPDAGLHLLQSLRLPVCPPPPMPHRVGKSRSPGQQPELL